MIRDEFLKQQKEKKYSNKEMQEIRAMGERAFFTTKLNKYEKLIRTLKTSAVFVLFILVVATIPIILAIATKTYNTNMIFPTVLAGLLYAFIAICYGIMIPKMKKKVAIYNQELQNLREKELERQKTIYNKRIFYYY